MIQNASLGNLKYCSEELEEKVCEYLNNQSTPGWVACSIAGLLRKDCVDAARYAKDVSVIMSEVADDILGN